MREDYETGVALFMLSQHFQTAPIPWNKGATLEGHTVYTAFKLVPRVEDKVTRDPKKTKLTLLVENCNVHQ